MGLFDAKCPVSAREQEWIEESMHWFRTEFGDAPLTQPVVLPTVEFFPDCPPGPVTDIHAVVRQVCEYVTVDPKTIVVELHGGTGHADLARNVGLSYQSSGAAGHYRFEGGKSIISIDKAQAGNMVSLVATVAHELAHARLLGEGRILPTRSDHEPLTDLLTVYLGLGIFNANARFDFRASRIGDQGRSWWSTSNLGYLTEPMFGYGLACFAWLRGEIRPRWSRYLDTNPRAYLKRGLRHLESL